MWAGEYFSTRIERGNVGTERDRDREKANNSGTMANLRERDTTEV
jgi:hypothetical protein